MICRLSDGEPIGTAGLHDLDFVNGNAEFGISLGEKGEWNKGYGTDALHVLCDFGFGELRFERIELQVYAANARARRSYEKAGFTLEGTLRHRHFAEGRFEDVLIMSLLRDEWAGAVAEAQLGAERARLTGLGRQAARCSSSAAIR